MKTFLIALVAALLQAGVVFAGQPQRGWQCWADASARYNIPVDLLYAIARVETGNRSSVVGELNKDGTYDIGLMQINSAHLPRLAKMGITENDLLTKPCLNLHIGAMILAEKIAKYGYTWVAVGAYNARSYEKRVIYARKVYAMYDKIVRERTKNSVTPASHNKKQVKLEADELLPQIKKLRKQIQAEHQRLATLSAKHNQESVN